MRVGALLWSASSSCPVNVCLSKTIKFTKSMARNIPPSRAQLEKLVSMIEQRKFLATGHARTANARQRSHRAWAEIAAELNSDGSGCVKTWEQWSKYWKDKKGAVKKKLSAIAAARGRTGGGVEDVPELNDIESHIVALMGGERFATGDRHLEINPFCEVEAQSETTQAGSSEQSQSILQICMPVGQSPAPSPDVQMGEEYEVQWNQSAVAVLGDETVTDFETPGPSQVLQQQIVAEIHPRPSCARDEDMDSIEHAPGEAAVSPLPVERRQVDSNTLSPTTRRRRVPAVRRRVLGQSPGVSPRRRPAAAAAQRSPRAGPSAARRRLLRRSPPSQRRSEMVSLTEKFIAIEERRAEAELINARTNETLAASIRELAQAWTLHAQALNALVDVTVTRNNNQ